MSQVSELPDVQVFDSDDEEGRNAETLEDEEAKQVAEAIALSKAEAESADAY